MKKFLNFNRDNIVEDASADRTSEHFEPIHATKRMRDAKIIEIGQIESNPQHREKFDKDALERLAKSLLEEGQLQPIRVRFDKECGKYIIIAGERRWRAAKIAKLVTLDCIVDEGDFTKADIIRKQIVENALREDLTPTESGKAYLDLMELEGLNGKQAAERLNIHASTVSRMIALLSLPEDIQQKVDNGELAITKALKSNNPQQKETTTKKKAPQKRATKEEKIKTTVGITVSLKARKNLKKDEMEKAVREALDKILNAA